MSPVLNPVRATPLPAAPLRAEGDCAFTFEVGVAEGDGAFTLGAEGDCALTFEVGGAERDCAFTLEGERSAK